MMKASRSSISRRLVASLTLLLGCLTLIGCQAPAGNTNQNTNDNSNSNANANDNTNDNGNVNDNVSVPGEPLSNFITSSFSGAGQCAICHTDIFDEADNDVSIDEDWRSTMMANAAKDPFFLAAVAHEVDQAPEALREVIEDTCANCHMGMAHQQAGADGTPALILDEGFLDPDNPLHEAARDGVSCTLCHQIRDTNLGEPESFSGGYVIDTTLTGIDRDIYTPFSAPQVNQMQATVAFTPVQSEHISQAGLCATCHTLFTPTIDEDGNIIGEFPEQTPFLEWLHSDFGDGVGSDTTCQQCHMPAAVGGVATSNVGNPAPRPRFSRHQFAAGNVFMLRLLRDNIEALGLSASTENFNATIDRAIAFLENSTARVDITSADVTGQTLSVDVLVTNLTGHKFPTGFPSRRAWIHLTVTDADGVAIFESGAPQDDGKITGAAADDDPSTFEPHYDLITASDEVQIYEPIMRNNHGEVTYTLLRALEYAKDNRLLPAGFDKSDADEDIAVYGAAAHDNDFVGGGDEVEYRIDVTGFAPPFTIDAELLFSSVSPAFVAEIRQADETLITSFGAMYDEADQTPSLIASDMQTVE